MGKQGGTTALVPPTHRSCFGPARGLHIPMSPWMVPVPTLGWQHTRTQCHGGCDGGNGQGYGDPHPRVPIASTLKLCLSVLPAQETSNIPSPGIASHWEQHRALDHSHKTFSRAPA